MNGDFTIDSEYNVSLQPSSGNLGNAKGASGQQLYNLSVHTGETSIGQNIMLQHVSMFMSDRTTQSSTDLTIALMKHYYQPLPSKLCGYSRTV